MSSQVTFKISGEAAQLVAELNKADQATDRAERSLTDMGKAMQRMKREERDAAAEMKRFIREAERIKQDATTPMQRYNAEVRKLDKHLAANTISQTEYNRAAAKAKEEMNAAGRAGESAFGPKAQAMLTSLAGAAGFGSVIGALGTIHNMHEKWLADMKKVSAAAQQASNEVVAFAALQEGGTKAERVRAAQQLAVQYGIGDRGTAFDTAQAMQSLPGSDWEKGFERTKTVFAASNLGVDLEDAKELEVLGASQGMKPGELLRMAYVSGQASSRDPATLAKAAAGMKFWDDKTLGISAAGTLAGSLPADQLSTYLKRGGEALSKTGAAQKAFEEAGLGEASREERLRYLARKKITTPEALKQFGFNEQRGIEAVSTLTSNMEDVDRIRKEVSEKAKPGLFTAQQGALFKEMPQIQRTREIEVAKARFLAETAWGKQAPEALKMERQQIALGTALREQGQGTAFGIDMMDEEGRATGPWSVLGSTWKALRDGGPSLTPFDFGANMARRTIRNQLQLQTRAAEIDRENQASASGGAPPPAAPPAGRQSRLAPSFDPERLIGAINRFEEASRETTETMREQRSALESNRKAALGNPDVDK